MGMAAGPAGPTRAVRVAASQVGAIELRGVPGQLATIAGSGSGPVMLTGQLHGTGWRPCRRDPARTGGPGPGGVNPVRVG